MSAQTEPETLTLEYDLFDLPTAQHKSGLVGLLLLIDTMKIRRMEPIPMIEDLTATKARIVFTKESMQTVFDDLYAADWVEIESKSKWQGKEPKRIEEKVIKGEEGKEKRERRFIYDAFKPRGKFLQTLYEEEDGLWVKLWRDMLWDILRGKPASRNVYEECANQNSCSLALKNWDNLIKADKEAPKGEKKTEDLAGTLFIGAQDHNAEYVSFKDETKYSFLLHFWTIASMIFAPRKITVKKPFINIDYEDAGFVLAIPEPINLEAVDDIKELLQRLETESVGYRPKAARIDLPEEAGLEYLYHFAKYQIKKREISYSLSSVELYHMGKRGNNIYMLMSERIIPNPKVLKSYDSKRKQFLNPLFKSQYLPNLLAYNPWYTGMVAVLQQYPWQFFIYTSGETPSRIPFFGVDVYKQISIIEKKIEKKREFKNELEGGETMSEEFRDEHLASMIFGLIREYVWRKAEVKSGRKYDEFKNKTNEKGRVIYPEEYRKAVEKVCSDAFLAMRGRREKDFIEYFTGTICSVPQFLPEEDYIFVSQSIITDWEKVKTLSMLALSAHSYLGGGRENEEKGEES